METIHCSSYEELDAIITQAGPDALYRGQARHYELSDGSPSLTTTFARQGCIPDLMITWLYYARQILRLYVRGRTDVVDLATDQAILQHYGWRSFFLDATGDARVAAWFASNEFATEKEVNLVEDCFESPVFLISEMATSESANGTGHLYIISRKALRRARIEAVHLSEIATSQGSPRYIRQDAYMVGPVGSAGLAADCVSFHVTAPTTVLESYAQGLLCEMLFPSPKDDPILGELLSMPWEKIGKETDGIDFFRRSLPLPEYKRNVVKHMPSRAAMYRPFWLKDVPQDPEDPAKISHILCSNGLYYGSSSLNMALPNLTKLLTKFDGVLIEPQGLTYHGMAPLYGKGIIVMKKAGDLLHISEIGLEHPGLQIHQIKKFPGLHFRIDDLGTWHRTSHPEDCDCGHDHNDHLRLLGRVDQGLAESRIAQHEENIYVELGVDPQSDAAAISRDLE